MAGCALVYRMRGSTYASHGGEDYICLPRMRIDHRIHRWLRLLRRLPRMRGSTFKAQVYLGLVEVYPMRGSTPDTRVCCLN